ncbi:hypothetical protein JCM21900_003388 [Sporobolomyces salmonicolor]
MSDSAPSPVDPSPEPIASTSSVPLPSEHAPLASLGNLPPELKALVVLKLAEVDAEADDTWEDVDGDAEDVNEVDPDADDERREAHAWGTWKDAGRFNLRDMEMGENGHPTLEALTQAAETLVEIGGMSGMAALSLVNREFSEMCFPYLWQDVDFEDRSAESILVFLREIIPRHARHIRSLAFGQSDEELLDDEPTVFATARNVLGSDYDARLKAVLDEAERLGGVSAQGITEPMRKRRARSLILAEVVKHCPNVQILDFEGFQKTPISGNEELDDFTEAVEQAYPVDHALEAIKTHLGPKLTDLTFLINDDGVSTEGDVASLLSACPNLLRLELECIAPSGAPAHRERLHEALLALNKLESLNVVIGDFINDDFASRTISWPLKVLALAECEDLSFPSFFSLIHQFSSTLEVLDLDGTPHNNSETETKKYLGRLVSLPKLDTLVLATPHDPSFVDAFSQCPIREFCLGFCPAFTYPDVEAFIEAHHQTLKKLQIEHDAALTEAQVESLEVLCHAKGIECELLEPEDDSDTDDDPSDFEDDFDQEEWEHDEDDEGDEGDDDAFDHTE